MGQKPQPSEEELEWVYRAIVKGLGTPEIRDEMLDDMEFPLRTDGRYFAQRRRELNAARKALEGTVAAEQDPLLIEKRRGHEENLVMALQELRRDPAERMGLQYVWTEAGPEHVSLEYWHKELEVPRTLEVDCLLRHLDSDDDILVAFRESAEVFTQGVELSTRVAEEIIGEVRKANLPFTNEPTQMVPGVHSQFAATLLDRAFGIPAGFGESYERRPTERSQISKLTYGGLLIAVGSTEQLDSAERIHREQASSLEHPESVATRCLDTRDRYIELSRKLNRFIDIRVEQRTFKNGPCEVCEAWGGLNTRNRLALRLNV